MFPNLFYLIASNGWRFPYQIFLSENVPKINLKMFLGNLILFMGPDVLDILFWGLCGTWLNHYVAVNHALGKY